MQKGVTTLMTAVLFVIGIAFLLHLTTITYAAEDNVTVDVNITELSEITLSPLAINWTLLTPGTAGGYRLLDIENTGSVNVTNIYAFTSSLNNETVRPYLNNNPALYSAGSVLVFHNESDGAFYWAGRIEWNWTEAINNIDLTALDSGSRVSYGFFRNTSRSFVWAVQNGTNGTCNNTGGTQVLFALEDDIDDGTAGTRTPLTTSITRDGADSQWSYFQVDRATSFLNGMCVAINATCNKIYVYNYDKRTTAGYNFATCANSDFIYNGSLAPNAVERVTADAWIPSGIPAGNLAQAVWTFVAT